MKLNKNITKKAIFLDRDGVINEEVSYVCKIEDFRLLPDVAQAIKRINQSEFLAIVITNQSAVARGLCTIDELQEIHKRMETLLEQEGAKLDGIYFCPHHPQGENPVYKVECNCRKPKIGMIKQAEKDLDIDLKNSFFIGDAPRDILCGKNAGIATICLETGHGCKDSSVQPDYFFENLYEAVNFILQKP